MKKIITGVVILVISLVLYAYGNANRVHAPSEGQNNVTITYTKLSASEARDMMEILDDFVLLDVRTFEEFAQGHIEGAILIPENVLRENAEYEISDKDAIILVYCRSGRRSALAARTLVDLGYTNVYDFGGIDDWPYEIIK